MQFISHTQAHISTISNLSKEDVTVVLYCVGVGCCVLLASVALLGVDVYEKPESKTICKQ